MSDIEVTLGADVKAAFESDSPSAAPTVTEIEPSTTTTDNLISEWPPVVLNNGPHMCFPPPLNATFFVKAETDDDSVGSTDTPAAMIFEVEQKMRDSIKAIQFKEMLLGRDRHSREVIIRRCIEWLQMPTSRHNNKTLDWFMSLAALKTADSLENSYLWHTLHESIYASESFKTVISFFDEL